MSLRPEVLSGAGRNSIDSSQALSDRANKFSSGKSMTRRSFLKLGAGAVADLILSHSEALSNPAETVLWNLTHLEDGSEITLEYMAQHSQDIRDIKAVLDENGNVKSQYALIKKDDGAYVYETHLDSINGKFTEFKALGPQIPIQHPLSVAVSNDGKTILVGGAEDIGGAPEKLFISYNSGKNWTEIPYPLTPSGGVQNLEPIADGIFFGNPSGYEQPNAQPFFVCVDQTSQKETIEPVNIKSGTIRNFNPSTLKINTLSKEIEFWSSGSDNLEYGINYYKISHETLQGTVENIRTVKIEGQDINLGFIYGLTFYEDGSGRKHALAANVDRKTTYNIDLAARTATQTYHGRFLDNKNIPDLHKGSLMVSTLCAIKDNQGKVHVWFAGGYATATSPYDNKAIIGHYVLGDNPAVNQDSLTEYSSQLRTQGYLFIYEACMEWEKYKGQTGVRFKISNKLGEAFLSINSDGSPVPNAKIIFPNNGIGSAYTKPVLQRRIWLPLAVKGFVGAMAGW